jgi:hypothetical protein
MGIMNTQIFNNCLLVKWIWKLYHQKDRVWARLLSAKYLRGGNLFKSNCTHGSQFWKSLHKVKHLFKWAAIHKVGDGKSTQLWDDVWILFSPLRIQYPKLYAICDDPEIVLPRGGKLALGE